jgi:ArsR family transcriptional regulator
MLHPAAQRSRHFDCALIEQLKQEPLIFLAIADIISICIYIHIAKTRYIRMINQDLRDEIMRMHAQVCAALADPTRILLLYSVSTQPRSVGELVKMLEISQPTVSRHLQYLRDRRLVVANREGQNVYYSLVDMRIIQALDLLRAVLADNLTHQSTLADNVDIAQLSGGMEK